MDTTGTLNFYMVVSLLLVLGLNPHINCSPPSSLSNRQLDPEYLKTYGWLKVPGIRSSHHVMDQSPLTDIEIYAATRNFQRFAGLPTTGKFDEETLSAMNLPRCGSHDNFHSRLESGGPGLQGSDSRLLNRIKRYTLQGTRWKARNITYDISKYTTDLSMEDVDRIIESSFKMWENVANISFTRVRGGRVHIDIRFEVGDHGDEEDRNEESLSFDGPGGTTAHAFFPIFGGDIHFDDDELWTDGDEYGINLFQVATHEIGHALGLEHSELKSSVMSPFYRTFRPDFIMSEDDIEAIQRVYGKRHLTICDDSKIDAALVMKDGHTYFFKGHHVYQLNKENNKVNEGYPRSIQVEFPGLPDTIDAAFTWSNGVSYFFKGDEYWRVTGQFVDSGFPKKVSDFFNGIPTPIDAVFASSMDEAIYFFQGSSYWKFDTSSYSSGVAVSYPVDRPISDLGGIPNNIDGALRLLILDENRSDGIYFFKGDLFWRFNEKSFSVYLGNPPYPRKIASSFLGCRK